MKKENNPLLDEIERTLRERILKGEYPAGMRLSENTIAKEFKCSRTPVRDVLKNLERDNVIEVIPHSGTYVKEPSSEENANIIEVRAALEAMALFIGAKNKADSTKIEELNQKMNELLSKEPIDFIEYGKVHYQFHKSIIDLANNPIMSDIYENLNLSTRRKLLSQPIDKKGIQSTIQEHNGIVHFLKNGEAEKGYSFMIFHLLGLRDRIIENS